jgi:glycosyltransferase involved in cell wall biosynthesis
MKILLVGNYLPDRQRSMQRFAAMLRDGLGAAGHEVRLIRPRPRLGRSRRFGGSARKWLAYGDKYLVLPQALRRAVMWADVVHICDHSNSMYVAHLRGKPHVVTCHDLLAVRGALGEETDCPATLTGKILQRWIFRSLCRAQMVACVSTATRADLIRLAGPQIEERSSVIMLGVVPTFSAVERTQAHARLASLCGIKPGRPFLLNVGSNLRRKNREGALRIFKRVSQQLDCDLVFAGDPLSKELRQLKSEIGLNGNVIEVPRPTDATLEALYSTAFALLYPTRFEGFGWPAIEAQTCGCPVVSSNSTSLPEVVGTAALLRAPEDEEGFATDVLRLTEPMTRNQLIVRGFENVKRFTPERMVNDYIQLYQKVCARS